MRARTLVLLAGLVALPPAVQAASKDASKLEKLLKKDKLDKVLETCADRVADGLQDPDVRDVCARAELTGLERLHPAGIPRSALDSHWQAWSGTQAGAKTQGLAAQLALREAGDDETLRRQLYADYQGTDAAETVLQGFWDQAATLRTIDAARAFQEEFPDTPQATKAVALEHTLAFEATAAQGTSEAWQALLEAYPEHGQLAEIQGQWMAAVWSEVEQVDTAEAWAELLSIHPEHPRLEEAASRRIDAIWRDSEALGPEGLLAFAKTYPTDPRSPDAWRRVHEALVQVSLNDSENHSALLGLGQEGLTPPWVDADDRSVQVRVPVPGVAVSVRLETGAGESARTAQDAWLPLLTDAGLPAWRVPAETLAIDWYQPDPLLLETTLSRPLCRADGDDAGWQVVVDIEGGVTLRYPFQVRERCASVSRSARSDVAITVQGRRIRLGWTQAEVGLVFPFQEPAAKPFKSDRVARSCLPSSGGDAVCFDFYDGLLVALDVACWSSEPCFESQGTYNRVVPDLRRPLRQADVTDTDDGARVTLYRTPKAAAVERQFVDPETGTPDFQFSVVDARFLGWVRPQAPAYLAGITLE